jgi:hypothetical protein
MRKGKGQKARMADGGGKSQACDRALLKSSDVFDGLRSSAVVRRASRW